ncbi:MAG TPA: hypothetical protein VFP68_00420 [Burkholderiaceae bacterium]|nr:hypothetical protein [Burkholderiaceae bacterium]
MSTFQDRDRLRQMWFRMRRDCEGLLSAYKRHCEQPKAIGADLLQAVFTAIGKAQPVQDGTQYELPATQHFRIRLHDQLPELHVLAFGEGGELLIKMAASDKRDDLEQAGKLLAAAVKKQAASVKKQAYREGVRRTGRDNVLHDLWQRRQESDTCRKVLTAWKSQPANAGHGDYLVLSYLQDLAASVQPAPPDVPDHPDIARFRLRVPGVDHDVDFLCRRDDQGKLIDFHVMPADAPERAHLIDGMVISKRTSASIRQALRKTPQGQRDVAVFFGAQVVKHLPEAFEAFGKFREQRFERTSVGLFVKHLNQLCDEAGEGVVVDDENGIRRYVVRPDGSDEDVTLLRRTDVRGVAGLRVVKPDLSNEAKVVKSLLTRKAHAETQAEKRRTTAEQAPSVGAPETPVAQRRPHRDLKEADQLADLLQRAVENKQQGLPPLQDVEQAADLPGAVVRTWLKPDGTLKIALSTLAQLNGYFELRDELCALLAELGDADADRLPKSLTAAQLVDALRAATLDPPATVAQLERMVGAAPAALNGFYKKKEGLICSAKVLQRLPGYAEHRAALQAALEGLTLATGNAQFAARAADLPDPERECEAFVRRITEHLYPLRLMMSEMQRDATLSLRDAALCVDSHPEIRRVAEKIFAPGGRLRAAREIAADVPGMSDSDLEALQGLLERLTEQPGQRKLTARMMPRRAATPAKIFLVNEVGNTASPTRPARSRQVGNMKTLKGMYQNSPELVVMPRSYRAEREKQVMRWVSSLIKSRFPLGREVQAYWDARHGEVWLSANLERVNAQIGKFIKEGGLLSVLQDETAKPAATRAARHFSKLRRAIESTMGQDDGGDASTDEKRPPSVRAVLRALCDGKIRVPQNKITSVHTGLPVYLHAGRRIKRAFEQAYGKKGLKLDLKMLAGTLRPCGICAKDLGLPPKGRRGPFWVSQAGGEGYDVDAVVQEYLEASIGTSVSRSADGKLSILNTDSDSDDQGRPAGKRKAPASGVTRDVAAKRRATGQQGSSSAGAALPVHEQDFIREFVGHDVSDVPQARTALRQAVLERVDRFIESSWHVDEAFVSLETVLNAIAAHSGTDVARAIRVAQELGEPLHETVMNTTVGRRENDVRQLHEQAEQAVQLLQSQGVNLPFAVPIGKDQTQQVLQALLDLGAGLFKRSVRRLERDSQAQPEQGQAALVQDINVRSAQLRRSSAMLGWLPPQGSPTHALRGVRLPQGPIWHPEHEQRAFSRGRASGTRNICWFDSIAQLTLGKRRGQGSDHLVDHLALRLRQAADRLGLSAEGAMFDDRQAALHVIARAMKLQVHTFQLLDGDLYLTPLQSVGSPTDPAVYLLCDDVHFVPMWRSDAAGPSEGAGGSNNPGSAGPLQPMLDLDQQSLEADPADAAPPPSGLPAVPGSLPVKIEPIDQPPAVRVPLLVETPLDQARTAFYEELAHVCDLTGDTPQWSSRLAETGGVIVHHRMKPVSGNDDKFPLRDPDNPERALKRYARADGRCHPDVKLKKIKLAGKETHDLLQRMCASDPRLQLRPEELQPVVDKLIADAQQEFERLIREQERPRDQQRRCLPQKLSAADVQDHEQALIGQYGLFVPRPSNPAEYPTLSKGRILGFYMGKLLESERQRQQAQATHPDSDHYAIDAGRLARRQRGRPNWGGARKRTQVTYAGLGSANSIAFANTALRRPDPDHPEPAYDYDRLNALFLPFDLELTDKDGVRRNEVAMALVALDNLFPQGDDRSHAQVLTDYGPGYLVNFSTAADVPDETEEVKPALSQ